MAKWNGTMLGVQNEVADAWAMLTWTLDRKENLPLPKHSAEFDMLYGRDSWDLEIFQQLYPRRKVS